MIKDSRFKNKNIVIPSEAKRNRGISLNSVPEQVCVRSLHTLHLVGMTIKHQQGQALITLLFFMIIGITMLTAASIVTLNNVSSTSTAEQGTIAYYNAEAGIEDALLQSLRYPASSTSPYTGGTLSLSNGGTATISANLSAGIIFSTGTYGSAQRSIKVTLSYTTGQKVASWQEVSHPW